MSVLSDIIVDYFPQKASFCRIFSTIKEAPVETRAVLSNILRKTVVEPVDLRGVEPLSKQSVCNTIFTCLVLCYHCTVKGTNQLTTECSHQLHHLIFKKLGKLRCNTETTPGCLLFTSSSLGWLVSRERSPKSLHLLHSVPRL